MYIPVKISYMWFFMFWDQLEKSFNNAMKKAFMKKKLLFSAPFLVLCGLIFVLAQTISISCGSWLKIFLVFIPLFLSFGILLACGVVLIKSYDQESQKKESNFKKIIYQSLQMILNIVYLCLPFIFVYIVIWIALGVFYLIKMIPILGAIITPIFAFIPFLLILSLILLTLVCLFFLFFATPDIALKSGLKTIVIRQTFHRLKKNFFLDGIYFIVAVIPFCISFLILYFASSIAAQVFFNSPSEIIYAFQSLFMMIPFAIFLSPGLIFFFNFSSEYFLLDVNEDLEKANKNEKNDSN